MQADAYAGFNRLYEAGRKAGRSSRLPAGPMRGASSSIWPGSTRRRLPVRRSSASMPLFAIEREINGLAPPQRIGVRAERSRPLVLALESWLRGQRARSPRTVRPAKPSTTVSTVGLRCTRFLDDGRLCMTKQRRRARASCCRGRTPAIGPSPGLIRGDAERRPSTRLSRPRSSTPSIRKPGLPTSSHRYSTIRQSGSVTSYRGTGTQNAVPPPDKRCRDRRRGQPFPSCPASAEPFNPLAQLGRNSISKCATPHSCSRWIDRRPPASPKARPQRASASRHGARKIRSSRDHNPSSPRTATRWDFGQRR